MSNHYEDGDVPPESAITEALADVVVALRDAHIPHLFMGGQVAASLGRPRISDDIDVFVRPADARPALDALAAAGFDVEETFPDWLFKGFKYGVLVDVIFRSSGEVYLDDEMVRRARAIDVRGIPAPSLAPEDLFVIKALATQEANAHHWWDALALLSRADDFDWEYLTHRARQSGPRRVLSLLLFAESVDLFVPDAPIRTLYDILHPLAPAARPDRGS